jgi:maltooligosyltrehalose trehalohydrolase
MKKRQNANDVARRLPIGAEVVGSGVHFRVWAPKRKRVEVITDSSAIDLTREPSGYFSGQLDGVGAGTHYRFRLDGGKSFPDPASRFQPDGPHGPSEVVDPSTFRWTDQEWGGVEARRQVLYEMHIGTFSTKGTWAAASEQLSELCGLGITTLEIMPVAEFPGRFGWGYDGVDLFAPYHGYGSCDDFRAFVDRAHEQGLGVMLDVVYNHFGPDGNYLREFSDTYFNSNQVTDWGDAINYDGIDSEPVRELALSNARHWIDEYHLDGVRLDATDNIYDQSEPNLLEELGIAAREAAGTRKVIVVAENEQQNSRLVRDRGRGKFGFGLDMVWNDDFHHTALVAATGRREAYFTDYGGSPQELLSAVKHGYLYQGQRYSWQDQRRGRAAWDIPLHRFVHCLENHDQVANSGDGRRLHQLTSPGKYRALTALLLLAPQTPMLFQGQEFGSSAPFLYFADHNPELAQLVRKGRGEFLSQFPSLADQRAQASFPNPAEYRTFQRSRLDASERERNREHYALHRDLITLRQCDPVLSAHNTRVDGAVIGDRAFVIRFFADHLNDRLLVVNLGADFSPEIVPEPLLAPPHRERGWTRLWHSEDLCYGGRGAPELEMENGSWRIPAESATLLAADDE